RKINPRTAQTSIAPPATARSKLPCDAATADRSSVATVGHRWSELMSWALADRRLALSCRNARTFRASWWGGPPGPQPAPWPAAGVCTLVGRTLVRSRALARLQPASWPAQASGADDTSLTTGLNSAILALCLLLLSVGPACRRQEPQRAPAIGFAYVAPE